ncbi:K(+)/H(+) antiporter [Myotisia sp. PD_48]|nr:K(+)/H(+) antiporter [Myotisia sp. PD_48]
MSSTITSTAASATASNRAAPQGGVFDKANPSQYDPKHPITLFIIQACIIVIFCRLIHIPLSRIRQPRVISEVLGGILLGPSVMGRIPGFREAIFPADSLVSLNLVANLGLVLYLFMIGVETDLRALARNWKISAGVSAIGMILPFGLGCAIAYGLYHQFREDPGLAPIGFGTYLLFIGIAMAITAFPVLCRILTELELLNTNVGLIVLSAGVGNDVVGWILLALCVALVNASTGLTALWVLLTCFGFILFLTYLVRPTFLWYLRRSGSLHNGPDQSVVALTLILALAAAFFTQVIGVHAIFGAFMVGIICPHDGGFAIKITEKIEDVIGALFLPLYFALSGLNTNIGLLDSGITWGYVIAVIVIAFVAKVTGGMVASRLSGLLWRESLTIGVLMSCKGLVELIVLNIGLQAEILSQRTFTIFVVMAIVTTFATTPIVSYLYPLSYQTKVERWRRGEIDWDGNILDSETDSNGASDAAQKRMRTLPVQKLLIYLRLDSLPGLFTFVSLLGSGDGQSLVIPKSHHTQAEKAPENTAESRGERPVEIHAVRLVELTDRDSSVMKVSGVHDYSFSDPILNTFRTFGQLNKVAVSGAVIIAPEHAYAETIVSKGREFSSDFILVPWSETGGMSERQIPLLDDKTEKFSVGPHTSFMNNVLRNANRNIGIFINKGFGGPSLSQPKPGHISRSISGKSIFHTNDLVMTPSSDYGHHIFLPYIGGRDDLFALRLVLQLSKHTSITATVAHFAIASNAPQGAETAQDHTLPLSPQEQEADNGMYQTIRDSLPTELQSRVVFQTINTTLDDLIMVIRETAKQDLGQSKNSTGDLVVVGRNSVMDNTLGSLSTTTSTDLGREARRALGVVGDSMATRLEASVLVVQAEEG